MKLIWKLFVTAYLLVLATAGCLIQFIWTFSLNFESEFKLYNKADDAPFSKAIVGKTNIFKSPFHHILGRHPERFY